MLSVKLLSVLLFAGFQADKPKTYSNSDLDLAFQYPSSWQLTTKRGDSKFTIPVKGGNATAEIYASTFRGTPEDWQDIQKGVNASMRRTVERQWQEEILGVPMLLTKLKYQTGAEEQATLVGLLLNARAKKMLFRLTSSSASFQEAESAFRTALESLQTTSGKLPAADNPDVPLPTGSEVPVKPSKPAVVISSSTGSGKVRLAPQRVSVMAGGVDVVLHLPNAWKPVKEAGGWTLQRDGTEGQVTLTVNSELDSPKPEKALIAASSQALSQFQTVARREEPSAWRNSAGAIVTYVLRRGTTDLGDFVVWNVVGSKANYYWQLAYRGTHANYLRDRRHLDELIRSSSVETTP